MSQLRDVPDSLLACLYLDNRHRLIEHQIVSQGDIAFASVKPAQIVSDALAKKAVSVILVSHVPQGILESSSEDEQRMQELKEALSLVNVRVLDHVIVGGGRYVSLAELRQL